MSLVVPVRLLCAAYDHAFGSAVELAHHPVALKFYGGGGDNLEGHRTTTKRVDAAPPADDFEGDDVRGWTRQHRELLVRWSWACADAETWVLALVLATWMRHDFDASEIPLTATVWFAAAAATAQLLLGAVIGPYAVGHQRGSLEEVTDLARLVGVVGVGLFAVALLRDPVPLPRSVPVTAALVALLSMCTLRFAVRSLHTQRRNGRDDQRRVVLLGAGSAGRQLVRSITQDPGCGFLPVALLDDDRAKARLRIDGVRVRGTRHDLERVARDRDATDLVIALPNAESPLIRELTEQAEALGLRTLVLPPLGEMIGGRPTTQDLRDVALEDLLGRRPIELDQEAIADQISGRTVLVTGAGGSIGSELCRQIAAFGPSRLLMLDRDESALHATQLTLSGHGLLDSDDVLLADIRDPEALHVLFQQHRPEVVFHAAALKHLPLLERYPLEGWKTNVLGTLNVLTAAQSSGVSTFVNVSTDKAADPTCVLGYSKRVAERLTADFARRSDGRYVSVRFGNVLGSRGSVVPAFTAQIARGGPVTVTHPDVRRFFMLIPEACQLVLQSAAMGVDGEVMVLDMGEQVKIVDVAQTLIRMSGRRDVQIRFTGLRPGEKLAEDLFSGGEASRSSEHELVSCVTVPPLARTEVFHGWHCDADEVREWMLTQATTVAALPVPEPRNPLAATVPAPDGAAPAGPHVELAPRAR